MPAYMLLCAHRGSSWGEGVSSSGAYHACGGAGGAEFGNAVASSTAGNDCGFFRIKRGSNEANIESNVNAVCPQPASRRHIFLLYVLVSTRHCCLHRASSLRLASHLVVRPAPATLDGVSTRRLAQTQRGTLACAATYSIRRAQRAAQS